MIAKERTSRLKSNFGTDKEYFLLKKNLTKTKETEILMIFFMYPHLQGPQYRTENGPETGNDSLKTTKIPRPSIVSMGILCPCF
jgi:hypothetical protein